jgi:hypothetical protein
MENGSHHLVHTPYFHVVAGSQSNDHIHIVHFLTPKRYLVNYSIQFEHVVVYVK